jgi:hypothetical protein
MLDVEASLLLASNASSAVPKELLNEVGQQEYTQGSHSSSKALANAALIKATEECSKNISRVANLMAALVEVKKMQPPNILMKTPLVMSSTPPPANETTRRAVLLSALMTFAGIASMNKKSCMTLALVPQQKK